MSTPDLGVELTTCRPVGHGWASMAQAQARLIKQLRDM